jgi:hypothetical protein
MEAGGMDPRQLSRIVSRRVFEVATRPLQANLCKDIAEELFHLEKKSPPEQTMSLAAMQDSNRPLLRYNILIVCTLNLM